MKIVFSNRYGSVPVSISRVTLQGHEGAVTFAGRTAVILPAGADVASDAIQKVVTPREELEVALTFDREPVVESFHWDARSTLLVKDGEASIATATIRLFLTQILVEQERACSVLIALGDSITDGNGVPHDRHERWTDHFANRASPHTVVNAGISGARLLQDGMGEDAIARLHQEASAHPGATVVFLALGTNDIAWPGSPYEPTSKAMSFNQMVEGYTNFVRSAHDRGLRVVGATIPPFRDALPDTPMAGTFFTEPKERLRRRINAWLRTSHPFETLVDLDRVLRDVDMPSRLRRDFDSGDHLHPGPAGNRAIAKAMNVEALFPTPC